MYKTSAQEAYLRFAEHLKVAEENSKTHPALKGLGYGAAIGGGLGGLGGAIEGKVLADMLMDIGARLRHNPWGIPRNWGTTARFMGSGGLGGAIGGAVAGGGIGVALGGG